MNVLIPQPTGDGQIGVFTGGGCPAAGWPTLYLLHGLSDDHSIWLRRTSIERYAAERGLAIVMPCVHRSYYADMDRGLNYWTFICKELPALAQSFFHLSARREDNFVAGLSMGGYGAFKLACNHPDRFAAAASLSGAVDVLRLARHLPGRGPEFRWTFGEDLDISGTANDLFEKAESLASSEHAKIPLYQACGDQDFLIDDNRRFRDHATQLGLNLTYEEDPGYGHSWDYWDLTIQRVLDWLPVPKNDGV